MEVRNFSETRGGEVPFLSSGGRSRSFHRSRLVGESEVLVEWTVLSPLSSFPRVKLGCPSQGSLIVQTIIVLLRLLNFRLHPLDARVPIGILKTVFGLLLPREWDCQFFDLFATRILRIILNSGIVVDSSPLTPCRLWSLLVMK